MELEKFNDAAVWIVEIYGSLTKKEMAAHLADATFDCREGWPCKVLMEATSREAANMLLQRVHNDTCERVGEFHDMIEKDPPDFVQVLQRHPSLVEKVFDLNTIITHYDYILYFPIWYLQELMHDDPKLLELDVSNIREACEDFIRPRRCDWN